MDITLRILKFILFIPLTLIFLPAFLIVTFLNDIWTSMLKEIFGL